MEIKKEKRPDRRTKYTKDAIKNAFLRVKRNKSYNTMTVTDVCREAEISRGTFYLHYSNLAQVLDEVLDEAFSQTNELFVQLSLQDRPTGCPAYPFCRFIREHVKYQCVFFDDTLSSYVVNRLAETYLPSFSTLMKKHTDLNRIQIESIFFFQMNGCFALSKRHRELDRDKWHTIQCTIDDFLKGGFSAYLHI